MYRKRGEPPTTGGSKIANSLPEPDDGQQGGWPRERLLAMDRRFVERLARAITAGDESPQGAAGLASVR